MVECLFGAGLLGEFDATSICLVCIPFFKLEDGS
jgi:hypothetical protein